MKLLWIIFDELESILAGLTAAAFESGITLRRSIEWGTPHIACELPGEVTLEAPRISAEALIGQPLIAQRCSNRADAAPLEYG